MKHQCLRFEELPRPGTLKAIDAEFVQMQQVLATKTTHYGLAFVLTNLMHS